MKINKNYFNVGLMILLAVICISGCTKVDTADNSIKDSKFFTTAQSESKVVTSKILDSISSTVDNLVEDGEIVGAELLIIEDRNILLHETYGWKNQEEKIPMEKNTIFRIRSMTKPFIGTSILMLVEEGKLSLSDPVSNYLPSFDNEKCKSITIEQLLTHTGGFDQPGYPKDIERYSTLREAVDDLGEKGTYTTPGAEYIYSDAGTATLGAVVSEVSGMPLEEFIEKRILIPFGMTDTFCNLKDDEPKRERISCTYTRIGDRYIKYWDNSDPQVLKYFRGSGGMYSTPLDYARFLYMWMNNNNLESQKFISNELVVSALTPSRLNAKYGYLWEIPSTGTAKDDEKDQSLPIFGHGGSDGTIAFAIPESNIMVFYFTQSRATHTTELIKYHVLTELGIKSDKYTAVKVDSSILEEYVGEYKHPMVLITVTTDGEKLYIKTPDAPDMEFLPASENFFFHELLDTQLTFINNEKGEVISLIVHQHGQNIEAEKIE